MSQGLDLQNILRAQQGMLQARLGISASIYTALVQEEYREKRRLALEAADPLNTAEPGAELSFTINLDFEGLSRFALEAAETLLRNAAR